MNRIPDEMLERMAARISDDDRDEMAIPSYLHSNPAMRWMAWRRVEIIADFLDDACGEEFADRRPNVMDFGCGTGVLFEAANRFAEKIYGVDLVLDAARMLVKEQRLERVHLLEPAQVADVISEGAIDIILAAEVLEHVDPLGDTLELFRTRLKPGGLLFVSVPTENILYRAGRRLAGFQGDYHHSDAASIDRNICASGFTRERMTKIPAPGPLAIYWIAAYRSSH